MTVSRAPTRALASAAALAVLVVGACSPGESATDGAAVHGAQPSAGSSPGVDPRDYADALVTATNAVRAEHGRPALEASSCATDEALRRAEALAGASLEHAPLDAVIEACAPAGGTAAENLSRAAALPTEVVGAWMDSHGHRANLLDPALTAVGAGCVPDPSQGEGVLVCAEVFLG